MEATQGQIRCCKVSAGGEHALGRARAFVGPTDIKTEQLKQRLTGTFKSQCLLTIVSSATADLYINKQPQRRGYHDG